MGITQHENGQDLTRRNGELWIEAGQRVSDQAVSALKDIARLTTFPNMKVNWDSYPSNAGHQQTPGCLRCHGKLVSVGDQSQVIGDDCQSCHYFELNQGIFTK